MYKIEFTARMKRNVKQMEKRGKNMTKLLDALKLLEEGNPLPPAPTRICLAFSPPPAPGLFSPGALLRKGPDA